MEMVKGRTLRDLTDEGPVAPARAFALTDKLLEVMEFAHAQGIVHRDLKPVNVMLLDLGDDVDRIKVLDFGLALAVETPAADRLTATGAAQGTPAYMSPEQCRGRDVGAPTDIYAIGTILYEMLCGETPFTAETFTELMVRQLFIEPPRLAERGTRTMQPPAYEALVQSALAKAPDTRPTSAAFRERIKEVLRGDDPATRAAREMNERLAHGALSREQRAPAAAVAAPLAGAVASGRAVLWGLPADRVNALLPQFAVNGIGALACAADVTPATAIDGQPVKAILVPWTDAGRKCLATIRANASTTRIPILVVDAALDEMPAIIRAGATDVAYVNAAPDAVCKQVSKLMRRAK
jgi:serine/threonine-protein kinase